MSTARRIFYNTLTQGLGKILAVAVGLLSIRLLAGYLGEEGLGQYSTVLAFLGMFAVIADFGLYLFVVREISKPGQDNRKLLSNAAGLRLTVALTSLLVGLLTALLLPYEAIVKQTMVIGVVALLLPALNQVLVGIFQKHLVAYLSSLSEIVGRAINLLLIFLFIEQTLPLPFFMLALALGNGAHYILTILFARGYEKFGTAFEPAVWRQILKISWPIAFAVIFNQIYFRGDTVILSLLRTQEEVGIYSLPYKILEILLAFPAMFVGLLMPILSRSAFADWGKFNKTIQRAFDAILLLIIPMIITTLYFAEPIINLIKQGPGFIDSPALLKILIFAAATIFLGTLFGYAVVAVNKHKTMILGYLTGAVVGVVLYLILIPRFGYFGAAYGTLVIELIVLLFGYVLVRKTSGASLSLQIIFRALPAAAIMLLFFQFVSMQWVAEAVIGLGLYTLLLPATKALPLSFIKEVLTIH